MYNIKAGSYIVVYDHPDGSEMDDWAEIYFAKNIAEFTVGTFEQDWTDASAGVYITYTRSNGLDGKVSRIEMRTSSKVGERAVFYTGNDLEGTIACTLTWTAATDSNSYHAYHKMYNGGCWNDDARSMLLRNAQPGRFLQFYDSYEQDYTDDVAEIRIKQFASR